MFRHYFGPDNVNSDLLTTEPEIYALVCGIPISIKTIAYTSQEFRGSGVKIVMIKKRLLQTIDLI